MLDDEAAGELAADSSIIWYQRFQLSENVVTPGSSASEIEWTLDRAGLPERIDGASVLDIGTTNGGAAFIAERRGAERIVAVDICAADWFGFDRIAKALGSKAQFIQASVYDLPALIDEQFDYVFFLGVLYHLRHPLLAIDCLRRLTRTTLLLETAVIGAPEDSPEAAFFRLDELSGDGTNWFAPNVRCLEDWVASSGFDVETIDHWPGEQPTRALIVAHPSIEEPEYIRVSYERPVIVTTRAGEG